MSDQPDFYTLTVTVKMTPAQVAAFAADAGFPERNARGEFAAMLQNTVTSALGESHDLREFTSYSVSEPE